MNNTNFEGALSWDSPIEKESSFTILPPGEYDFKVDKMERTTYQPSPNSKIRDVSPQAELEITIFGNDGESTTTTERLILHSKTEWKMSEFFIAIGQKKQGEPLVPNWSLVPGATGRCEVEINKYKNKEGQERENNRITNFLPTHAPIAQPIYTAPHPSQQAPAQPVQTQAPTANPGFSF